MWLKVKIRDIGGHKIRVHGITDDAYMQEDIEGTSSQYSNGLFKYTDTITLNILSYIKDGKRVEMSHGMDNHQGRLDETYLDVTQDGLFEITHIILPSKEWIDQHQSQYETLFYYYNEEDGRVYKGTEDISVTEFVDTIIDSSFEETKVSYRHIQQFYIKYLRECLLDYSKRIWNNNSKCFNQVDQQLVWNRDFIWMALHAIEYYIEDGCLEKAQELLNRLKECNGICRKGCFNNKVVDCGCSKK